MNKEKSFSYKVVAMLKRDGRTKTWLAEYLGITRTGVVKKIKNESWTVSDIFFLTETLNIK